MANRKVRIGPFDYFESFDPEIIRVFDYIKESKIQTLRDCTKRSLLLMQWVGALVSQDAPMPEVLNAITLTRQRYYDAINELDRIEARFGQLGTLRKDTDVSRAISRPNVSTHSELNELPEDNF